MYFAISHISRNLCMHIKLYFPLFMSSILDHIHILIFDFLMDSIVFKIDHKLSEKFLKSLIKELWHHPY